MWQYQRVESEFPEIPEGTYRCKIVSVEKAIAKSSGNDMLVIKLELSGQKQHLWTNIVFLNDRPEITNRMLTQMFDCFEIEEGNFDLSTYVGKVGACKVRHDENGKARMHYFIRKKQQEGLPSFVSVIPTNQKPEVGKDGFMETPNLGDEEIPF